MDKLTNENKFAIMPEWVIELDISHTAFRLYAVLARYADNVTHQAFPSLETLSERLGCSEKTVRRAIEDLVKHGAIEKQNRGRYQSSLYTIMTTPPNGTKMSREWTKLSDEGTEMSLDGTKMSIRLDTDDQVTITTELEPIELQPLNDISATEFDSKFEEWWSVYPNRKGKGAAKTAYKKALKKAGHELLVDSARRYRDDPNREQQFTPYPQKWLNEERWEDSPEPVRQQKLTNAEKAVQLALKYRQEAQREHLALEAESIIDIEEEPTFTGSWLKGVEND